MGHNSLKARKIFNLSALPRFGVPPKEETSELTSDVGLGLGLLMRNGKVSESQI